jgi:hypothetical protein
MSIVDVIKNVSLDPIGETSAVEPTAAKGDDCVFFTQGFSVRLSTNSGSTFQGFAWSSPHSVFPGASGDFFGDQSTLWAPQTKRFIWAMVHGPTRDAQLHIRLAFTSAAEMKSTQGRSWTWLDIDPSQLGLRDMFDYPQLSIGENFLYITAHLGQGGFISGAIWIRIALQDLVAMDSHSVGFEYFVSRSTFNFGMAQRCRTRAFWASHEGKDNLLRLYFIDESSHSIGHEDVAIPKWNTTDYQSLTPDGQNWLDLVFGRITGTFFAPDTMVFGWTAGRDSERPHPYIYLVEISQNRNSGKAKLAGVRHIFNREHAWAFPALGSVPSAGRRGPLAMSCGWGGGNRHFSNHSVGFVDLPLSAGPGYTNKTVSKSSIGAVRWGDFLTVGNDAFEALFLTAGYEIRPTTPPGGAQAVPHYVVFSPL